MMQVDEKNLALVQCSDLFDADWYLRQYPDVAQLGMEPAEHYLMIGSHLGRDPSPYLSTKFAKSAFGLSAKKNPVIELERIRNAAGAMPDPKSGRILHASNLVALVGNHERAVSLAEQYLPEHLKHTINILSANEALHNDLGENVWLNRLNHYVRHFGLSDLTLKSSAGSVFSRLSSQAERATVEGPLITVIMAAYNAEKTIEQSVESIANQTWKNIELLIVDDCSTDGTWGVLCAISKMDPRIKIYRNCINVGPYVSKNVALKYAKGEWVTGQDADDWSHPQRLEQHMILAKGEKASTTCMIRMTENGMFNHIKNVTPITKDGVTINSSISCLYHVDLLKKSLGYWDSVRFGGDSELIDRAAIYLGKDIPRYDTLGMVCLNLESSLSNHPEWGIQSVDGQDSPRKLYRSAWQSWHGEIKGKRDSKLYLPFPQRKRSFDADQNVLVSNEVVSKLLASYERVLQRLVFIVEDVTVIGGVANRTRSVMQGRAGREYEYVVISRRHSNENNVENSYSCEHDEKKIIELIEEWSIGDTVFFVSNNTLKDFSKNVVEKVMKFPICYIAAAQTAFMLQDSKIMLDKKYVENFKVSKIISFSDGDINFQRQLGIHGQVKGFVPVGTREVNDYDPDVKNVHYAYVGRIDFAAKDCMKLIDIAAELRCRKLSPIKVFTTDGSNSPDFRFFMNSIKERGLEDQFDVIVNCTDKDKIFDQLKLLILPSCKESFGNVVVEAYSYGVPVIAASYAPGPAEIIDHKINGILLDELTGTTVVDEIESVGREDLLTMSRNAFDKHNNYSLDDHLSFLEEVARGIIKEFNGVNMLPVLPRLTMLN
ncbi:glycosyltransferase [Halomonas sp. MA07-2]|uniref:glycosyltransferase n=1 Tax=Halomonas sp. MA07-2 TaxID=3440841 RepID=UPI003EEF1353